MSHHILPFITVSVSVCECQNKGAAAKYFSDEEDKAQEIIKVVSLISEVKYLTYSENENEMLAITPMRLIVVILSL